MPIELHPACKQRLIEFLDEHLPSLRINHRRFVDINSTEALIPIDLIIPSKGKTRDQLSAFSDDQPVYELVIDTISRMLWATEDYKSDVREQPIQEIYADLNAISRQIVSDLEALPLSYTHTFALPNALLGDFKLGKYFALSKDVRIIRSNDEFISTYPLTTFFKRIDDDIFRSGLLRENDPKLKSDALYFQVQSSGYVTRYGGERTTDEAKSMLKAFLGLGIGLRLFVHKLSFSSFLYPRRDPFYVHDLRQKGWRLSIKSELEPDLSETISQIELFKHDTISKHQVQWTFHNLMKIRDCLANPEKSRRVVQASMWLFDSYVSQNELLAFVQAMIALEILFGDKQQSDLLGLGELLRNRCAYLIGTTQAQRDEILRDFGEIYSVRSQIVHRGKSRLSSKERLLFGQLRWMCGRAIQEEIELIQEDLKKDKEKSNEP